MNQDGVETVEDGRETTDDRAVVSERDRSGLWRDQARLVPPAVTPIRTGDVAAGLWGQLRGTGCEEFRARLEWLLDGESSATYTSFRRALGACLLELSESDGPETVLIPAFCSPDFRKTIEGVGLEPREYDVEERTLAADLSEIEAKAGPDTLAVVAVNVLGFSSPMTDLAALCEEQGCRLIEALGYALGSKYEGEPLGTFGDCAVCNFQQGKPIPVGGGMVISQRADLEFSDRGRPAVRPNLLSVSGYAAFGRPRLYYLYKQVAETVDSYRDSNERPTTHPASKLGVEFSPPFATMSNFQGSIAQRVLARNAKYRRQRARVAVYYERHLRDCRGIRTVTSVEGLSSHQFVRYPLVAASTALRDAMLEALRDAGIESTTLYHWPVIDEEQFPRAARLQQGTFTLPTHPYVDETDRHRAVQTVLQTLTEC